MVNVLIPPTYEELDAQEKIILLDHDDMSGAQIDSLEEDHMTYLVMFERARDTKAKEYAIQKRKQALILSGQSQKSLQNPQAGAINGVANASASQMTNAAIQQNSNGKVNSTANVSQ